MSKYIIEGGKPLRGTISIGGCKNAALPIMAAALISDENSTIKNIPDTSDVKIMAQIIASTGAHIQQIDTNTWEIGGKNIDTCTIKPELARQMRSSILLVPPILTHCKKIEFPHPGGCVIGTRPLDTHFEALRALGVSITANNKNYIAEITILKGTKMFLDEVSVTATENALMLASISPGETIIEPAACEPHVVDLANFLIKAGAKIEGAGTHIIKVTGVEKLHAVQDYSIIPDNIEAGTYAIAAVATGGEITIKNIIPEDLDPIIHKLKQMGGNVELSENTITIRKGEKITNARIQIDTWPRLPTDIQAPFGVLATQAEGTSLVHDWMYEKRLAYIDDLLRMGANITVCDPHRALITGPTHLYGTKILSPDIRAGIALVIAALIAEGKSEIDHIELIDRGYEYLEKRLQDLGAQIKRVD
ncbi:MAG: UDP-N-acetylglucosamine 1-carboxyvinyltransferase [bacterium]|nr:UDP-N-acetylglucosamine 1-carboxyvinyltransferase [bacterium]